jgi:hypothetical protein
MESNGSASGRKRPNLEEYAQWAGRDSRLLCPEPGDFESEPYHESVKVLLRRERTEALEDVIKKAPMIRTRHGNEKRHPVVIGTADDGRLVYAVTKKAGSHFRQVFGLMFGVRVYMKTPGKPVEQFPAENVQGPFALSKFWTEDAFEDEELVSGKAITRPGTNRDHAVAVWHCAIADYIFTLWQGECSPHQEWNLRYPDLSSGVESSSKDAYNSIHITWVQRETHSLRKTLLQPGQQRTFFQRKLEELASQESQWLRQQSRGAVRPAGAEETKWSHRYMRQRHAKGHAVHRNLRHMRCTMHQ